MAFKVRKGKMGRRVHKASKAPRETMGLRGRKGYRVFRDQKALLGSSTEPPRLPT